MTVDWREAVKNAEHHLALGKKLIYTTSSVGYDQRLEIDADQPWDYVTSISGCHAGAEKLESTVYFHAEHSCGLIFEWYMQIAYGQSNRGCTSDDCYSTKPGSVLEIWSPKILTIYALLPKQHRDKFLTILHNIEAFLESQAKEKQNEAKLADDLLNTLRKDIRSLAERTVTIY